MTFHEEIHLWTNIIVFFPQRNVCFQSNLFTCLYIICKKNEILSTHFSKSWLKVISGEDAFLISKHFHVMMWILSFVVFDVF